MSGRPIGRTPAGARSAAGQAGHAGVHATCRWCPAQIMWLAHQRTGTLAPIDLEPVPGGNVLVHRSAAGRLIGTYSIAGKDEVGLFDATAADPDARPTLHVNHWATCSSPTARRLARERSRSSRPAPSPSDRSGPPPAVVAARGCAVCGGPMDRALLEAEPDTTTHPACGTSPLPDQE